MVPHYFHNHSKMVLRAAIMQNQWFNINFICIHLHFISHHGRWLELYKIDTLRFWRENDKLQSQPQNILKSCLIQAHQVMKMESSYKNVCFKWQFHKCNNNPTRENVNGKLCYIYLYARKKILNKNSISTRKLSAAQSWAESSRTSLVRNSNIDNYHKI